MALINNSVMVADGGGGHHQPDPKEEEINLSTEDVQLDIPIYLNELLYDISDYYSTSLQDLVDGVMQVKAVDADVQSNDIWNKQLIKESLAKANTNDITDYITHFREPYKNHMVNYADNYVNTFYDNIVEFSEIAMQVEYMVALVESELKHSLTPEEYDDFINSIKENSELTNLEAFTKHPKVGNYVTIVTARTGAPFGAAIAKNAGMTMWLTFKEGGLKAVAALDKGNLLTNSLKKWMSGDLTNATGKVPTVGGRLLTSVGTAAFFFALGIGYDIYKGEFSWENVGIRAARGGVAVASSLAGSAVSAALSGTAAGSWAGPIGMAVGCVVGILGNLVVDAIVHEIHYASNDLPKQYESISVEDVREALEENGYLARAPRLGENEEESMYDAISTLSSHGASQEVISFIEQKVYGFSSAFMDLEEYQEYNVIFRRFKTYIYEFNCQDGCTARDLETFISMYETQRGYNLKQSEREFTHNLFELFNVDNLDDSEIHDFYDKLYNWEILDDWDFDYKNE